MNEVEAALKAYQENQAVADLKVEEIPARVRPGRESQKRDAQAKIQSLRDGYRDALRKAALGFIVMGEGTEAFVKITLEEASDTIVLDAGKLYDRISDRVEATLGVRREFGVGQFSVIINELRDIIAEIGIASMPAPKWREGYSVQTRAELVSHVRAMIEQGPGPELLTYYLERQLCDAGLKVNASRTTVPVIVTGFGSPEAAQAVGLKLFGEGRVAFVTTTKDQTREQTIKTLTETKKNLKRQSK